MGKKMAVNSKAEEARAKKENAKSSAATAKSKAEEDAYWASQQGPKGKKDKNREEEEKRRLESAAKKAELKKLAAEEEAELAKLAAKKKAPPKKVTQHTLALQSEAERKKQAALAQQRSGELKREISEDQYAQQVEIENQNRGDVAVDARSLDAALAQMSVSGDKGTPEDRHPEKRAKAAWEEYYARELVIMKEEKPGLKLMQYKNRIFEKWQRSPENPRNQVPAEK